MVELQVSKSRVEPIRELRWTFFAFAELGQKIEARLALSIPEPSWLDLIFFFLLMKASCLLKAAGMLPLYKGNSNFFFPS